MIPALYNKTKEALKSELGASIDIESVCLTADLWTSRANESYLAVTGHYNKEDYLKSIVLDCSNFEDSHTSENIQTMLNEMISEWNL